MNQSSLADLLSSYYYDSNSEFSLDLSRAGLTDQSLDDARTLVERALEEMTALERGDIVNKDEGRAVGHYWLRSPELAPSEAIRTEIEGTIAAIEKFSAAIRSGEVRAPTGQRFSHVVVVGIGGSALGPQLIADALRSRLHVLQISFIDNTDPDGIERALLDVPALQETLVVVISKSGGTKETRNGELILKEVFKAEGVAWPGHFVAVTGNDSDLDRRAIKEGWLARFPMWDWVGGRTSELSAVGLLPAALQGVDIRALLQGAAHMDRLTRNASVKQNPAMWLALAWYQIGEGKGAKDMVVLPYKDRLQLMSRYLQQLVMESLGKYEDRAGTVVKQGIAVYGNKGSTDQHAYVQQLRDGVENFFATFIQVLEDGGDGSRGFNGKQVVRDIAVEPGVTAGDYLFGFLYGTREALSERGRRSITLAIRKVDEFCLGQLIALFERAVGFYASFVNINAYHQPGVEAGKKAAASILEVSDRLRGLWHTHAGKTVLISELGSLISVTGNDELLFHMVRRAAVQGFGTLSLNGTQSSFTFGSR